MKTTIYSPKSAILSPRKALKDLWEDIIAARELGWRLFLRNIRSHYRQTALGAAWAVLSPLATTLVWIFLSNSGILKIDSGSLPYPLFVLSGTMLWQLFLQTLLSPMLMLNNNKSLLGKINFPKTALIMAGAGEILFNFSISLIMLAIAFMAFQYVPSWKIIFAPLGILAILLFGLTIGLLITPFGMLFHDVGRSIQIGTKFLFYVTPAAYPIPAAGLSKLIMELNPLSSLLLTTRDWLTDGNTTHLIPFLIILGITIPLFLFSLILYKLSMPYVIERVAG